jgi:hypothetical protein
MSGDTIKWSLHGPIAVCGPDVHTIVKTILSSIRWKYAVGLTVHEKYDGMEQMPAECMSDFVDEWSEINRSDERVAAPIIIICNPAQNEKWFQRLLLNGRHDNILVILTIVRIGVLPPWLRHQIRQFVFTPDTCMDNLVPEEVVKKFKLSLFSENNNVLVYSLLPGSPPSITAVYINGPHEVVDYAVSNMLPPSLLVFLFRKRRTIMLLE